MLLLLVQLHKKKKGSRYKFGKKVQQKKPSLYTDLGDIFEIPEGEQTPKMELIKDNEEVDVEIERLL